PGRHAYEAGAKASLPGSGDARRAGRVRARSPRPSDTRGRRGPGRASASGPDPRPRPGPGSEAGAGEGMILEVLLGVLTGVGGFVESGELVFAMNAGARFGTHLIWVIVLGAIGIIVYGE